MQTLVETPTSLCRLGIGVVDITPPVGMYHRMWGAARHDQSTGIHRPLRVSAAVFGSAAPDAEGPELLLVALDHCVFRPAEMDEVRARTAKLLDIEAQRLTIVFSHTHAAGLLTRERADLPGGDLIGPYLDSLPRLMATAVQTAREKQSLVTLTYGSATCAMGHNRDGWDASNGICVCGFTPDQKADLPVNVVRATRQDGSIAGVFVTYPCHPTTLAWENTLVSPDYVGALRETIEQTLHAPCVFLLAPCGDIGPRVGFLGDPAVADCNGRQVAYAALQAFESLPPAGHDFTYQGPVISGATLGNWRYEPQSSKHQCRATAFQHRCCVVPLEYRSDLPTIHAIRQSTSGLLAQEQAARASGNDLDAQRFRALVERQRRLMERILPLPAGMYPYRVDLWRLGDSCWIAVDGEPYFALQAELQSRFPGQPLVVMALSNGARASYLPTRQAYSRQLYQVDVSILSAGSLERVIEAVAADLAELCSS